MQTLYGCSVSMYTCNRSVCFTEIGALIGAAIGSLFSNGERKITTACGVVYTYAARVGFALLDVTGLVIMSVLGHVFITFRHRLLIDNKSAGKHL